MNSLRYLLVLTFFLPHFVQAQNCIKGNCENGYGTLVYPSGARYEGNFKDGFFHGKGVFDSSDNNRYIGDWVRNIRQGKGRMIFANGDEYFGAFVDNKIQGQGEMKYANGNFYSGNWENERRSGRGELIYANGDKYKGDFFNDYPHGQGTMIYNSGAKYIGEWQNGKENGSGTFYTAQGQPINGQWARGQLQENWDQLTADVDTLSVRDCNRAYCDNITGKYKYRDGTLYVGQFSQGRPQGEGVVIYPNGDRYRGAWYEHSRNGKGIMYYASGRIMGGIWSEGQLVEEAYAEKGEPLTADVKVDKDEKVKIWAVVVGAATYTHMPRLRYTDDDAYQVYAFLKSPEGGALPDNQIEVLIDENATKKGILLALKSIFLQADENDVLLFYFSGHGIKGSFLPIDYDGVQNKLDHEEIKSILKLSRAKHKLIVADACHSGSLVSLKAPLQSVLNKYYKAFEDVNGGTALLMSSKGEEYSLEDGGLRSGIFSHFLIKGLKGEADADQNKIVTIQELYSYVYSNVRDYTGNVQTPTLTGNFNNYMPVANIR